MQSEPHHIAYDLEADVLGAVLVFGERFGEISDEFAPSLFVRPEHRTIAEAIVAVWHRHAPISAVTVREALRCAGMLDLPGSPAPISVVMLVDIMARVISATQLRAWLRVLIEYRMLRDTEEQALRLAAAACDEAADAQAVISDGMAALEGVARGIRSGAVTLASAAEQVMESLEAMGRAGNAARAVTTGLARLDDITGPIGAGDLIVLAARPGMGKTAFALHVARSTAQRGTDILFFTIEMTLDGLVQRIVCSEAGVSLSEARAGRLQDRDWITLSAATARVSGWPIVFDETAQTDLDVCATAARECARRGIGLIIVDYLQLLTHAGRAESRERNVAEMSRAFKLLAKRLGVPIIVLSQLNREVERRDDKYPSIADLRESGAIEQDADMVWFLYYPEKYGITAWPSDSTPCAGMVEVIVAKHRNGPTDKVRADFNAPLGTFRDHAMLPALAQAPPDLRGGRDDLSDALSF